MDALNDGRQDVRHAAEDLASCLPEPLRPLAHLAYNYAWSWTADGPEVFGAIDRDRFELCLQNPVRLLQEAPRGSLHRAAHDDALLARIARLEDAVAEQLGREPDPRHGIDPEHPVAFLCAEYGVHVSLPVYSGGLGALAGDILKEASDQALPMVAVGLMYRKGYFRQRIDAGGWQHEYWIDTDPERLPAARVTGAGGEPVQIEVPIRDRTVRAQLWRVDVGRVPLLLLDTDIPDNPLVDRWITARLYEGDTDVRLAQYMLLGIGGVRALRALGIDPAVIHLNEGHAALAPLELALGERQPGEALDEVIARARERTIFTTHTPVPAGNDTYPADQAFRAFQRLREASDIPAGALLGLGQTHRDTPEEPFGVTQAALRMSRAANAVSRRHGEVAREMWTALWPGRPVEEVPIAHVTNGVHVPTWIGPAMRELLDRHLGEDWLHRAADPDTWAPVEQIPDEDLWAVRQRQRAELVEFLARRSTLDRLARTDLPEYVTAAAEGLRGETLTLGFARRVATYKRLNLLTRDPEWALSILGGDRPVQIVLAGKAHPRDDEAKRSLQGLFGLKGSRVIAERVVFLDDYDLATGAALVRGCDVWLNLPRPPLEASGTSGMKNVINGGLQLSVLDGWWAEGYQADPPNGWAIPGEVDADHEAQDARDSATFHRLLAEEVVPAFYDRDERAIPPRWLAMVRASLTTLGWRFSATRMLEDYAAGPYRARSNAIT